MDSMNAFVLGEANRNKEEMVFDWDKAAQIIREKGAQQASAGLQNDWEWTGGTILVDGVVDKYSYTYLASTWAIPELEVTDRHGIVTRMDCYRMQSESPGWYSGTKWPQSAMDILAQI